MGHSSINVNMDTYGHLMNTVNQESAKRLDGVIFGQTELNYEKKVEEI